MVFWENCRSSRSTLRGEGRGGRAQHVNVIRSIDPRSNVTDCSYNLYQNCRAEDNLYIQKLARKQNLRRPPPLLFHDTMLLHVCVSDSETLKMTVAQVVERVAQFSSLV